MQPYYYRSSRNLESPSPATSIKTHNIRLPKKILTIFLIALISIAIISIADHFMTERNVLNKHKLSSQLLPYTSTPFGYGAKSASANANRCNNSLGQYVLVSISQRHLWACQTNNLVYDSPVVTGISYLAADMTPVGTYHVQYKETHVTLTGSDTTGKWSDPVSYWMPFLFNQYGAYGFHDATWRPANAFGHISPSSPNGSHGCVELPLSTAKWLYGWIKIGTTVIITN